VTAELDMSSEGVNQAGTKVLLVEDDENENALYEQVLTAEGYRVFSARSGMEALDMVKRAMPDLAVIDISMPGMDGIELMNRLLAANHRLPVILNTAYSSYQDDFRAWSADECIVKSSDVSRLSAAVKRVLEARRR
jgi:CheY-like chemotaxis protein